VTGEASPDGREADFVLQVTPEPTDDERDALIAALTILLTEPIAAIAAVQPETTISRWARAGRQAAFDARRVHRGWRWPRM
jgi:hypothetical protein